MATISKSGINPNQLIKSEHLTRIIDAFNGLSSVEIIISGSLKTVSSTLVDFTSAEFVTGSFKGDGSQLTGIPTGSVSGSNISQFNNDIGYLTSSSAPISIITTFTGSTYTISTPDAGNVKVLNGGNVTVIVNSGSLSTIGQTAEIDYQSTGSLSFGSGSAVLIKNINRSLTADGQNSRIAIQKMSTTTYRIFGELGIL